MSDYPPPGRPRPSDDNEPPETGATPTPPPSGQDWGPASGRPGPPGDEPPAGGGAPPPPPPGQGWGAPPPPPPPGYGGYGGGGYGGPGPGYGGPGGYRVGDAFRYAFDKFKDNLTPLLLITLGILVAVGVLQLIGSAVTNGMASGVRVDESGNIVGGGGWFGAATIVSLLFSALSLVVQLVIQAGIVKASLGITRGEAITAGNAFGGIDWVQVVVTALVIGVLTFIGLILCVLPGIVVVFFTSFALYFVIDRNMQALDAIKASFTMVTRNFGPLILFFLAALAAYIVGACLCGVGLLAAIPIVVIAQAYTFRTLNDDPVTA